MTDDQYQFLNLGWWPARLTGQQVAWVLNCQPRDIPILIVAQLLKPLDDFALNGLNYFATADILEVAKDIAWLDKMTATIDAHWQKAV